jgi:hypothetical protein
VARTRKKEQEQKKKIEENINKKKNLTDEQILPIYCSGKKEKGKYLLFRKNAQ